MINNPVNQRNKAEQGTQANYDRLSRWYDLLAGQAEKKSKERGLELLEIQVGEKVLEIGFGTGHCLQVMAQSVGETGKVFGIDLSTGMLRVAQARLGHAGLLERVELHQGNALTLPYADSLFNALYMSFTLELFDTQDIPLLLSECHRVLHANGRISIVSLARGEKPGLMVKLYDWAHRNWPVYIDCRPIHAQSEIDQAGFHTEQVIARSLFGLPVDIILARKRFQLPLDN